MRIFVMRHGEAEIMANSDKERHLTENGKKQSQEQGSWLKSTALSLDKVLVSPYARAQETFAQVDAIYEQQLQAKMETWQGITPYGSGQLVQDYLALLAQEGTQSVLLVSHLPLVGEIVATLCGQSRISFYPSTIVEVEWNGKDLGQVIEIKYPS